MKKFNYNLELSSDEANKLKEVLEYYFNNGYRNCADQDKDIFSTLIRKFRDSQVVITEPVGAVTHETKCPEGEYLVNFGDGVAVSPDAITEAMLRE